eukprot:687301_1
MTQSVSTSMAQKSIPRIKLLTIGDSMVGKSCIVKRFCEEKFYDRFKPTIGIDYGTKKFKYADKEIKIDFWDMSGNDEFEEVRKEFYDNTQICFVVFDCADKESFDNLQKWINEARKYEMPSNAIVYIVCNKIDTRCRVISKELATEWCETHKSNNFRYYETSAKSGEGIQDIFNSVFEIFLKES